MKSAMISLAVFAGKNGLDFYELRSSVVRIPEVSLRIREAQAILDSLDLERLDLFGYLVSEDAVFFRNSKLKNLVSAIVQIGLFDRMKKTQRLPTFMIGTSNGDSAVLVASGQVAFADFVTNSSALQTLRPSEAAPQMGKVLPFTAEAAPVLTGASLNEFQAYRLERNDAGVATYVEAGERMMDLKELVVSLIANDGVTQLINVGPAQAICASDLVALEIEDVETLDSIELDPMLGWFWTNVRRHAFAQ